jgi:hypothetical protein
MSSFYKPLPNRWKPEDLTFSGVTLQKPLQQIAKTVRLLESRCDDYAEYLGAVFVGRDKAWSDAVNRWNLEECQHGEALRLLCESVDPDFRFTIDMASYTSRVSYHAPTGQSVRDSVGAELVSRCVVEALASMLYRVLADSTDCRDCQQVFSALAKDEARHFGMFLKMLNTEAASTGSLGFIARCSHAFRRMLDLEDGKIMVASCIVAGRGETPIRLSREANWYLGRVLALYCRRHIRYAVRMLLQTIKVRPGPAVVFLGTLGLWSAVKMRWIWARALSWRLPFNPNTKSQVTHNHRILKPEPEPSRLLNSIDEGP